MTTAPSVLAANQEFELIIDYSRSEAGCILSENLVVSSQEIRFDIECDCIFVTPGPVPHQFRATVPGVPAGLYAFEAIHVDNPPTPRTVATTQILIGQTPSIPISPLALTILSLILATAAVSILRR